jgi:hypothetical protein
MKEYISIPTLNFELVSPELINDLVSIYPEGEHDGMLVDRSMCRSFGLGDMPRDDPRVEQVLQTLRRHGWYPRTDETLPMQPNEFFLTLVRKYTRRDLEQCEYLKLNGRRHAAEMG